MIAWLKRHWILLVIGFVVLWILLVIGFVVLFFVVGGIEGLIAKHSYKKSIKEKDIKIGELWGKIGDSKKKEDKWKASSEKNWDLAMEKEAKIRKKDAEMRVKLAEKRALKKKIKEMPAPQVVIRTIEIIQCDDVVQQDQGIIFSLDCAKNNLAVLEDVFYFKKEALDWAGQFFTSQAEVSDLKNVIIGKDGAYAERGVQLTDAYGIIDEWEGKFNLSEKRGKRSWKKGFKLGGTIGGILGFLAGFVLGK
jgi:hypothetical protein